MSAIVSPHTGEDISHYHVDALIGTGGMGDVYRATDVRLRRRVAIKFLRSLSDPSMRQRLVREAQAASLLDHPNICTIFEVDETPAGEVFIVMGYYEGETLDRVIAAGQLDLQRALSIAVQTARGLAAAHEELIVHRDIKPANLMIGRGDTVKILDFGLARLLKEAGDPDGGTLIGTPAYMSPEQLRGEPVDQRADIWALGVVLYEMVTGVPPFAADNMKEVIASVLGPRPVVFPSSHPNPPGPLRQVIERALAKSLRARFERIEEMDQALVDLQTLLDSTAITLRVPPPDVRRSIAVLPFEDMSSSRDQEFLCDGFAEEILRALNRIPDLHVASRTSAFQFKRRTADIREIGALLNVDTILEGSVRRVGERVRISAQLISVKDGYRLWNDRYDREMKDIFEVEDEIADQIARALKVALKEGAAGTRADTPDAQAYECYLQGRQFIHQHRRKAFENALQIFSQAIEIHPDYARAYAGIADCHSFLRMYFGKGDEALEAAERASARALELDPDLSDAHAARGMVLFLRGEFARAEHHLRRATEIEPRLYEPHYMSARLCFSQGRIQEAAEHFAEACRIVPEAYASWYLLGMCYRRLGQQDKAHRANRECIEAVNRWVRTHPDDTRAWTMGASVLAEMGEPERSAKWVERALAVDSDEPIIVYNAACVYVALGRHDEALRCLESSLHQGGLSPEWVANDPDLDPLRGDPRFLALLERKKKQSPPAGGGSPRPLRGGSRGDP